MKDYINLIIRVNIAIFLASEVVAALVIPFILILIIPLLIANQIEPTQENTLLFAHITTALIIFIAGFWVFKATYLNMKRNNKPIQFLNSVLYSIILYLVIRVILSLFFNQGDIIGIVILTISAFIAFYLAGRSAEKKLKKEQEKTTTHNSA